MAMDFTDVGGAIGSLVGYPLTAEERRRQEQAIAEERALYDALPVDIQAQLEEGSDVGPSAFESLQLDPRAAAAQYAALGRMGEIANANGLDRQAQARLAQVQAAGAGQERAQRGAILDRFNRQGMGNSNAALSAALIGQQGSAQRTGMEGVQAAGEAEARAYRALGDSASLGGQIRGQDYQQASDRAGAVDRVAAMNAANRQAVAARNADRQNRTLEGNRAAAYQRAGMQGGTYRSERDYYAELERKKRGLYASGGQVAGAGAGYVFGAPPIPGGTP
jgi:hypothetical protein